MSLRGFVQTLGFLVAQMFDDSDPDGVDYTYATRARHLLMAARYGWQTDGDDLAQYGQVPGTPGPLFPLIMLPAKAPRKLTQFAFAAAPVKVTTVSPLKVTPVYKVDGSPDPFVLADDLDEFEVVGPKDYSPTLNDPGFVFQAAYLGSEQLGFMPMPSGGAGGSAGDWGDFSDGNITLDGTTPTFLTGWRQTTSFDNHNNAINAAISYDSSYSGRPTVYKMVRNCWFDELTIDSGVTLITNGYRIYARKILGSGKISMNPIDYMDDGSGIGWAQARINVAGQGNMLSGGAPTLNANGGGGNTAQNAPSNLDGLTGSHGTGWGGAGGNCGAKTGGATVKSVCDTAHYDRASAYENMNGGQGLARADTASGGSAGGSDASHLGGLGGAGGGVVQINCEDMSGFTGTIDTSGSPGEPGDGSIRGYAALGGFGMFASGGGGGGGGGGGAQFITTAIDGTYTAVAAGGAGGIAGASGTAGSAGTNGYIQRRLTT